MQVIIEKKFNTFLTANITDILFFLLFLLSNK